MEAAQRMDKLIGKLVSLLQLDTPKLIDFECLVGNYTRKKTDEAASLLQQLQDTHQLLTFEREDYGFRINIQDMKALKNFQAVSADWEAYRFKPIKLDD